MLPCALTPWDALTKLVLVEVHGDSLVGTSNRPPTEVLHAIVQPKKEAIRPCSPPPSSPRLSQPFTALSPDFCPLTLPPYKKPYHVSRKMLQQLAPLQFDCLAALSHPFWDMTNIVFTYPALFCPVALCLAAGGNLTSDMTPTFGAQYFLALLNDSAIQPNQTSTNWGWHSVVTGCRLPSHSPILSPILLNFTSHLSNLALPYQVASNSLPTLHRRTLPPASQEAQYPV